tara:strand:+ start:2658 stop:3377 length:720 start_codon:yes stop_codon:yes gene_type:complete
MYIGWDIGIKNLAYCIINEKTDKIVDFNIINLIEEPKVYICSQLNKNGSCCKSKAQYVSKTDDIYYCNKHYNKLDGKQQKLIKKIKAPKKVNKYSLEELGMELFKRLDENPLFLECTNIIIENQPVLKNPTMKSIQIMLYSYFLIKNKNIEKIKLVNASNKLKVCKEKLSEENQQKISKIKDKYRKNKTLAIIHCEMMISDEKVLEFFNSHKKKDDLADAYLMTKYLLKENKVCVNLKK